MDALILCSSAAIEVSQWRMASDIQLQGENPGVGQGWGRGHRYGSGGSEDNFTGSFGPSRYSFTPKGVGRSLYTSSPGEGNRSVYGYYEENEVLDIR